LIRVIYRTRFAVPPKTRSWERSKWFFLLGGWRLSRRPGIALPLFAPTSICPSWISFISLPAGVSVCGRQFPLERTNFDACEQFPCVDLPPFSEIYGPCPDQLLKGLLFFSFPLSPSFPRSNGVVSIRLPEGRPICQMSTFLGKFCSIPAHYHYFIVQSFCLRRLRA